MVIEASESECLVMSLVENIARRTPRPIDLMREIGALRSRGYNDAAIAEKIGVGASWVNMITSLLNRGEERLVAAVETGLIPITLAMEISKAETEEAQNLLLDAYETGKLRGKKLAAVRRMLEMRMQSQRKGALPTGRLGRKANSKRMTAADLMQVYQREAEKQRLLVKKSDFTQTRLLFVVEALKDLLANDGFINLLRAEGLATMPRALKARVSGGDHG
ncbi:plasmid partitioning protein RepB C-terminal domain-containing protein [Aureimonas altamirensis]|uniref:plasmid partitioning protein RepB C-terminal domain-containing protein n=1 Tax=Aureimonas altamirensis TaxID=370622 RepID=UPI0030B9C791